MLNNSCNEFLNQLASGAAVPGGGGASALCGALGAALGSMVCNLTLGKKKYAGVQQDIQQLIGHSSSWFRRTPTLLSPYPKHTVCPKTRRNGTRRWPNV